MLVSPDTPHRPIAHRDRFVDDLAIPQQHRTCGDLFYLRLVGRVELVTRKPSIQKCDLGREGTGEQERRVRRYDDSVAKPGTR